MKKLFIAIALTAATVSASAQDIFNHLSIGAGIGTTGISVEVATPITRFLDLRAGASFVPGITFNADADYTYTNPATGTPTTGTVNLKGDFGRVQGQVILNFYPAPVVPFYIAAGAYFGGDKLMKITGKCDDYATIVNTYGEAIIGGYKIPADEHGNISGGFKVHNFRPYVGIGWGRAIPGKLVNFAVDLGIQIQSKPELYTDYGEIDESAIEDDNTFNKIANALKVYPTLTFHLNFRAF